MSWDGLTVHEVTVGRKAIEVPGHQGRPGAYVTTVILSTNAGTFSASGDVVDSVYGQAFCKALNASLTAAR